MNMESGAALRASIATLPFFQYRVNAVSDGWRGASATRCPLARRWSLYSKHSSRVACRSSSVIPSNFPGSMYLKQMYFIFLFLVLVRWVGPARTAVADCSVTVSGNEEQH